MDNLLPAGLRGRVILGKGNNMEELIKRLERVIATGAPDKDGMHPISAEAVLEVVKQLSEHGTNLASLGTDCISREQAACEYCHEDSDGYVMPLEKNCHAFIRFGMDGWELSLNAKGWHGSTKIKYCPMCGRSLTNE